MACKNCFDNCDNTVSDKCVKYTGEDIEILGICNGDQLSSIEAIIIEKLLSALDGTGITLGDISFANAPYVLALLGGKSKTLTNLIQALVDGEQSLKTAIDGLKQTSASFPIGCLDGLPTSPTRDQILAATITAVCETKELVATFDSTFVKIGDVNNIVNQIINANNNSVVQYKTRAVPYVAMPYHGPLSKFDNTGKGISTQGYDKIYICNGQNGTPDYRGRSPIGAIKNVPGPSLDSVVNPNSSINATGDVNYEQGKKYGEAFHKLTVQESAPHTHSVTDPGHKHSLPNDTVGGGGSTNSLIDTPGNDEGYSSTVPTGVAQTNISIGSSGGGSPHNTVHPTMAAVFIMYIP